MRTQKQMFYDAERRAAELNKDFMFMVNCKENPLTREDLEALLAKRPQVYARFAGFLKTLPRKGE